MIWQIILFVHLFHCVLSSRVDTLLFAPWTSSSQSPLFEAGEFFSSISDDAFLEYIKQVSSAVKVSFSSEEKEKWINNYCDSHYDKDVCDLLRLGLTTREFLPEIQLYQDLASPFLQLCPSSETFLISSSGYQCLCGDSISLNPYPTDFNLTSSQIADYLETHQVDHVINHSTTPTLYILLSTYQTDLLPWLSIMQSLDASLVLRPYHSSSTSPLPNSRLGGYAVALDIKNTEYKVIDDRSSHGAVLTENEAIFAEADVEVEGFYFSTLLSRYPSLEQQLTSFRESLITDQSGTAETIAPIQMKDLGLKVVQRVAYAQDPLRSLADSVLQFPATASSIAHVPISDKLEEEWSQLSANYKSIENVLLVNGKVVSMDTDSFSIFEFLEDVRSSLDMKQAMKQLGLSSQELDQIREIVKDSISDDFLDIRVSRDIWENEHIWYLNNIEKDRMYSRFPKSLNAFFITFQLPAVRTNYLNYVVVMDPMETRRETIESLYQILRNRIPIRCGIVFTSPAIRSFFDSGSHSEIPVDLEGDIHPVQLLGLLSKLLKSEHKIAILTILYYLNVKKDFSTQEVIRQFNEVIPSFDVVSFLNDDEYLSELAESNQFVVNSGIREEMTFLNGRIGDFSSLDALIRSAFQEASVIIQGIESKEIHSINSVMDYLFSKCVAIDSFDEQLMVPFWDQTFTSVDFSPSGDFAQISFGDFGKVYLVVPSFASIQSFIPLIRVLSDYSLFVGTGNEAVLPALRLLQHAADLKIMEVMEEVMNCAKEGSVAELKQCMLLYLEDDEVEKLGEKWETEVTHITTDFESNKMTCIFNGRIVERDSFSESFIRSLIIMDKVLSKPLHEGLKHDLSKLIPFIHKYLNTFGEVIPSLPSKSPFVLSHHTSSLIHFSAVLDPLTTVAQRAISLMQQLRSVIDISYDILLLPSRDYSQLPLKRFYQFVLSDKQQVVWHNLPMHYLYTMSIETPFKWSTVAYYAECDLDNLRILDESTYILAQYIVDGVVIEGSCFKDDRPAAGVMLQMNHYSSSQFSSDTVVMNNMGYWQLRGNMGFYEVTVSDESNDVQLVDTNGNEITSVKMHIYHNLDEKVKLLIKNKPVSTDKESPQKSFKFIKNLMSKVATQIKGSDLNDYVESSDEEEINIFSLASGHLYERFLKIMMLSVSRSASMKVHFWLIENFLSPQFKDAVPELCKHFGYKVSYVSYKWPRWVYPQTEKQRIIWAYKILFLDTLFPLRVKKIIYVDADQVSRVDLKELWDMDIHEHVYAYTPLCTTNPETKGFMFWTQGYWKDHLQGKPYHISALYKIDLELLRKRGVGDILREVYNGLAPDPNSLSNLDQDLPNFIQDRVPIYSLPQEWLWCESWCSMETKAQAKTIDLCNNPMHKEPKLDMAKRVISGPLFNESWTTLDNEIHQFEDGLSVGNQRQPLQF